MSLALALSALLMGLAGSWHCAVMCGASSAAVQRACGGGQRAGRPGGVGGAAGTGGVGETSALWTWVGFQLGRLLGYAAAGAVVASSVAAVAQLGQWTPALRPVWAAVQAAALGFGLWLLFTGRQPAWLAQLGRRGGHGVEAGLSVVAGPQPLRRWAVAGAAAAAPLRSAAAGTLWFAWPCGLLQSALMLAALANGAWQGAAVMAAFAMGSALGLGALPLWRARRLLRRGGGRGAGAAPVRVDHSALLLRAAGAALAAGAAWALGHGLWAQIQAYCA